MRSERRERLTGYARLLRGSALRQTLLGLALATLAGAGAAGLVGLAGWFIAASALAGISGAAGFIVAYPSSGIRAFAILRTLSRYGERLVNHRATFSLLARLRVHFFERALALPAKRLARYRSGDLLNRALADVDALDNALLRVLVPTVSVALVSAGSVAFVAYHSPPLALILTGGLLLGGLALPLAAALLGRRPGEDVSRQRSELRTRLVEALEGLPEIRSYGAGRLVASQIREALDDSHRAESRSKTLDSLTSAIGGLFTSATTFAVLFAALALSAGGALTAPLAVMTCLLTIAALEQTEALPAAYRALGRTRAAARRLDEIFDARETAIPSGSETHLSAGAPGMVVDDLTFAYSGRQPAFENLSLKVSPGYMTAVTGPSGSGKTTLLGLLAGELEPSSGRILYDSADLREIPEKELRDRLAYVGQDEHIFDTTLRENLQIAGPEADDERLLDALRSARLSLFVEKLEYGLDTPVGEHGRAISGGQRKRLAVARALLREPDLLLLDEPTGSLDRDTARRMMREIRTALPRSTILVATHDAALASAADTTVELTGSPASAH